MANLHMVISNITSKAYLSLSFLKINFYYPQTPLACLPAPELTSSSEASALLRQLCWRRKIQWSRSSPSRTQWSRSDMSRSFKSYSFYLF